MTAPSQSSPKPAGLSAKPERLKRRREFLEVAGTRRKWVTPGMIVQIGPERPGTAIRYGVTASKKVGNAVKRNRAKRRLRALADQYLPELGLPGWDYVLIARNTTPERPHDLLISDLKTALARLKVTRPAEKGQKSSPARDERTA